MNKNYGLMARKPHKLF